MPRPLLSETTGISQNGVRMLIHTVTPGETLSSIAADYNLTVSYLERINELPNPEALVVGQDIVIAYTDTIHTVSEGILLLHCLSAMAFHCLPSYVTTLPLLPVLRLLMVVFHCFRAKVSLSATLTKRLLYAIQSLS